MDARGVYYQEMAGKDLWTQSSTGSIMLDGVRVSEGDLLGDLDEGFRVMAQTLNGGRLFIAALSLASLACALDRINGSVTVHYNPEDPDKNILNVKTYTDSASLWVYAAPIPNAGVNVEVVPNTEVQFIGSGTDEDGIIVKYEWDLNGDGVYDWSSTLNGITTHIYNSEGTYTAVLRLTDNDGFTATDSRIITVSKAGDGGGGDDGGGFLPAPSLAAAVAAVAVIALRRRR